MLSLGTAVLRKCPLYRLRYYTTYFLVQKLALKKNFPRRIKQLEPLHLVTESGCQQLPVWPIIVNKTIEYVRVTYATVAQGYDKRFGQNISFPLTKKPPSQETVGIFSFNVYFT